LTEMDLGSALALKFNEGLVRSGRGFLGFTGLGG
jgi:hypothetical protein